MFKKKTFDFSRCFVFLSLFGVCYAGPGFASPTVPNEFVIEEFATLDFPRAIAFPPSGLNFTSFMYVSADGDNILELACQTTTPGCQTNPDKIFSISSIGSVNLVATLQSECDPSDIAFPPPASTFGNFLYISCNNRDGGQVGDQGGAILRVGPTGGVGQDFTAVPPNKLFEPAGITFGPGGNFGFDLYVANAHDLIADILTVNDTGGVSIFLNDGLTGSGLFPSWIAFGPGGNFGTDLFFTQRRNNLLSKVDFNATLPPINVATISTPVGIVFSNGTTFGEKVFIGNLQGEIWTVDPDGTTNLFASGFQDLHSKALAFNPDGTELYVADFAAGKIYRIKSVNTNNLPIAHIAPISSPHPGDAIDLDGTGSSDPDPGDILIYSWSVTGPGGTSIPINNSDQAMASFVPTLHGDYLVELTVTDEDRASDTTSQLVSTINNAPIADAGMDQAVTLINTNVQLKGCTSYDLDGDALTYQWTLNIRPVGSIANLSDETVCDPTFFADVKGTYQATLVVTDEFGAMSPTDSVVVSFDNIKPVADAGPNQMVVVTEIVDLDGSNSSDVNQDPLTYQWSITTKPTGSTATLNDSNVVNPMFTADEPGIYIVSLVVNDGLSSSDPSTATITAISISGAVFQILDEVVDIINSLDPNLDLKNKNMQKTLTNKISSLAQLIENGEIGQAIDKLTNDLLAKTNGCTDEGIPDNNDWLITCSAQSQVYPKLLSAITLLQQL